MNAPHSTEIVAFRSTSWTQDALDQLFAGGWPEFIFHDAEVNRMMDEVRSRFGDYELALTRDSALMGATWAVPIAWNGSPADLPTGYTDTLRRALVDDRAGAARNTLAVMAASVHPDARRSGVAIELIEAHKAAASARGFRHVICPVRPTLKPRYPLTDIAAYVRWKREDGLPLDPWLRTHVRMGGRIIGLALQSQSILGSVTEWEEWTGMAFPSTGDYVISEGLSVLHIERKQDLGTYTEPNVWVDHSPK